MVGSEAVWGCQALIVAALTEDAPERVVDGFVAEISRLPGGHPERGRLAGALVMVLGVGDSTTVRHYARQAVDLLRIAETDPPPTRRWVHARAAARTKIALSGHLDQAGRFPGAFGEIVGRSSTDPRAAALRDLISDLFLAPQEEDPVGDQPRPNVFRNQSLAINQIIAAAHSGDTSAVRDSLAALRASTGELPVSDLVRIAGECLLGKLGPSTTALAAERPGTVRRCRALIVRALTEDHGQELVDEFAGEIARLPADDPERGRLAAGMVIVFEDGGTDYLRQSAGLLEIAEAGPPPTPRWPAIRQTARLKARFVRNAMDAHRSPDALGYVLAITAGSMADAATAVELGEQLAALFRAGDERNLSELDRLAASLPVLLDRIFGGDPRGGLRDQLLSLTRLVTTGSRNGLAGLRTSLAEVPRRTDATLAVHEHLGRFTDSLRLLLAVDGGPPTDDQVAELAVVAERPDLPPALRVTLYVILGEILLAGGDAEPERVERGIAAFRAGLALTGATAPVHRAVCQAGVAFGLSLRSPTPAGFDEAASLLRSAREQLGGPGSPLWMDATNLLADVRRRTGQVADANELRLLAQRGFTWSALRESSVVGARDAVRDAAGSAIDVARQCLQANDVTGALRALDTGRGLMLFAAVELPKVPGKLRAAGHEDLARRWSADGGANAEVRRAALTALAGRPDVDRLLDPPSLDEIRVALAAVDADALVYLVPAEPPAPGLAVIAPADGPPVWLELPDLDVRGEVERYLGALTAPTRDLAPPPAVDGLAAVGEWAWRVAVGPLLERHFPAGRGRVPGIVLVPMGELARIPWEAARRGDGVYAIELAAFSHAVSARLLCENAALTAVAPGSTGLIVGDPETAQEAGALTAARAEAHALWRGFYQDARYVGRRPNGSTSPSGAGTAAQVRRWLADQDPATGGMVHLACHGCHEVVDGRSRAYLLLAPEEDGEPASRLSAEEIVVSLAESRRRIGLVVLAACHSGRSVHGFDEAYSLGTAFLAGRVRSVLSAQWAVPDKETSALMYLFHHYRVTEHRPARQALRLAQLWLLDPRRRPPDGMPAELLASVPEREPAPVFAWAGFVHYGQ